MVVVAVAKQVRKDGFDPLLHDLGRPPQASAKRGGSEESVDGGGRSMAKPKLPLDHRGKPVRLQDRTRYKYARAYTIMYDSQKVCCAQL